MIYAFQCEPCDLVVQVDCKPFHPPPPPPCSACGKETLRIYGAQIDTSACKDHDFIPEQKRVQRSSRPGSAATEEARFHRHIQERRAQLRDGNRGSIRHTHSVPADLYHGKIRETGDRDYWKDPKNLSRHSSTRVG